MEMRNHEGYHDPTAGKAIRRVHRAKRRGRCERNGYRLTYQIRDVRGFSAVVVDLGLAQKG